ncbi:MAG: right-handed parallel beta-helix repeat-containing protein, partial [Promethearchaeota archaeon]
MSKKKGVLVIWCGLLVIASYCAVMQLTPGIEGVDSGAPLMVKVDPYYIEIYSKTGFETHKDSGNGTLGSPYVIENRVINMTGQLKGGISIFGTGYHFIIRNCVLIGDNYYAGIEIWNAANGTLMNNTITKFRYGISVKGASMVNISENQLNYNHWRGLELAYVLASSHSIQVINNTMMGNVLQSGCRVEWVYDCTFINNTFNNNGAKGLWLKNAHGSIVTNNVANANGDYGFLVEYAHLNNFTHNRAHGNPVSGFRATNSITNHFINNTVTGSGEHGFQLINASQSHLLNTTITNNGYHGILVTYHSSYNTIMYNTIQGNGWDCIFQDSTSIG